MPSIPFSLSWVSHWLMHCYDHTEAICTRSHNYATIWPIEDVILKVWHILLAVDSKAISRASCYLACRQSSIPMHGASRRSSSSLDASAMCHQRNSIELSIWG